jgi:dephospho-CoA kinase
MRGLTEVEAAVRVDAQPPQEEKAALADWVIVNDGDLENLRRQVVAGWAQISGLA